MMQEKVAILLNERENQKRDIAVALQESLAQEGITASRWNPSESILQEIEESQPTVIVTDFILEGYGTGLDLISHFENEHQGLYRPGIIFLTDEPSLDVAVSAMRIGAKDYILTTETQALQDCLTRIKSLLSVQVQRGILHTQLSANIPLKDLVLESAAIKDCLKEIQMQWERGSNCIVLHGNAGVGKSQLAKAVILENGSTPFELDFQYCERDTEAFVTDQCTLWEERSVLSEPAHLIFSNVDLHAADITRILERQFSWLLRRAPNILPKPVFMTTANANVASALEALLDVQSIKIPNLNPDRSDDISPLVQHYILKAQNLLKKGSGKSISADLLKWCQQQDWPGNIPQVREVASNFILGERFCEGTSPKAILEELYELSLRHYQVDESAAEKTIDPLQVMETLALYKGNLRMSAAHIGCSVRDLITLSNSNEGAHGSTK